MASSQSQTCIAVSVPRKINPTPQRTRGWHIVRKKRAVLFVVREAKSEYTSETLGKRSPQEPAKRSNYAKTRRTIKCFLFGWGSDKGLQRTVRSPLAKSLRRLEGSAFRTEQSGLIHMQVKTENVPSSLLSALRNFSKHSSVSISMQNEMPTRSVPFYFLASDSLQVSRYSRLSLCPLSTEYPPKAES